MTEDIMKFTTYLAASDKLIEQATKEKVADVARVLAFHVGDYRTRYGDLPTSESLNLLSAEKITDEMTVTLASGLEALIEVLKALGSPKGEH